MGRFGPSPIETLNDWNAILSNGCCCEMPECPSIDMECESLAASALSYGHQNPSDTIWKRYLTRETTLTLAENHSATTYNVSTSASETNGSTYNQLFQGGVGDGSSCPFWLAEETPYCSSAATKTLNFTLTQDQDPPETRYQTDRSDVSGTETDEHIQWEADEAAWLIAHPSGPTRAEARATYEAWELCEGNTPGECGPEPDIGPDEYGFNVDEPVELYDDCTYKDTTVFTDFTEDPDVVETTYVIGYEMTTVYTNEGDQTSSTETAYSDGKDYAEWVSSTRAALVAEMTFPQDDCLEDPTGCFSYFYITDEPVIPNLNNDVTIELRKVRYRWAIDPQIVMAGFSDSGDSEPGGSGSSDDIESWWKGIYFKVTWDVLFEPEGWDDTVSDSDSNPSNDPIDPSAPDRELHEEGLTWLWSGPGDPHDEDSWKSPWFDLDVPVAPGVKRVVNVRYQCYRGPFGSKPQTWGDAVDIPSSSS